MLPSALSVPVDDGNGKLLHIIAKIMKRKNISLMAFDEILICFSLCDELFCLVLYKCSEKLRLKRSVWLLFRGGELSMFSQLDCNKKNKHRVKCYRVKILSRTLAKSMSQFETHFLGRKFFSTSREVGNEIVFLSAITGEPWLMRHVYLKVVKALFRHETNFIQFMCLIELVFS